MADDPSNDRAQRLLDIRRRLGAVSGPWTRSSRRIWDDDVPCVVRADYEAMGDAVHVTTEEWDRHELDEREAVVAQAPFEPHGDAERGFLHLQTSEAAMEFIAHSWGDIKWLLEQVEK